MAASVFFMTTTSQTPNLLVSPCLIGGMKNRWLFNFPEGTKINATDEKIEKNIEESLGDRGRVKKCYSENPVSRRPYISVIIVHTHLEEKPIFEDLRDDLENRINNIVGVYPDDIMMEGWS